MMNMCTSHFKKSNIAKMRKNMLRWMAYGCQSGGSINGQTQIHKIPPINIWLQFGPLKISQPFNYLP